MAASTSKRVLAIRFDREPVAGFIDPNTFRRVDGIEMLSPAGSIAVLPYADVKALCFVKDFESFPEWKMNRVFAARPKSEGLWVRLRFRDGDQMDGLVAGNLLTWEPEGFTIAPPDPTFHNQRMFVPRAAVSEAQVMGVIGTPLRRKRPAKPEGQLEMFEK